MIARIIVEYQTNQTFQNSESSFSMHIKIFDKVAFLAQWQPHVHVRMDGWSPFVAVAYLIK